MSGTGHIMYISDPSLPDRTGLSSVYCALPLVRVSWIGYFPLAASTGIVGSFNPMKLAFDDGHKILLQY